MADKPKCSVCNDRPATVKGKCQRCYQRDYVKQRQESRQSTALVPATPAYPESSVLEMPTVHLVARNPQEMQAAQIDLAAWLRNKLRIIATEITDLTAAYEEAARNGWRTEPLERQLNKA